MASALLTKTSTRSGNGSVCDQTELLSGAKCNAPAACADVDEAASSFLTLEEGSEASAETPGGRRRKSPGAACACRLAGERVTWLLLGLLLLAAVAATAVALHLYRGREIDALRREVEELKQGLKQFPGQRPEAIETMTKQLNEMMQSRGQGLRTELDELKRQVTELDLYIKLRQFEDEVYEMEEDGTGDDDDDEDEDDDDDDLPPEDEDDVDYYPDSEAVEDASAESGPTPGPQHRGRFHEQYENMMATHSAPPHGAHAQRKKPGTEPAGGARAAAAAEAASEAEHMARHKREIASASSVSGVPVLSRSYADGGARRSNGTEGLSLYETLVGGGGSAPPLAAPRENKMLRSGVWPSKRTGKENRDTAAAATRREHGGSVPMGSAATPMPSLISRQSNVMQTATPAAPNPRRYSASRPASASRLQWMHAGQTAVVTPPPSPSQGIIKVYQDQRGGATLRSGGGGQRLKKKTVTKKTLSSVRDGEETSAARPQHPLRRRPVFAAHYGGDSSAYRMGHEHYGGNGRLRHPNKMFTDWLASDWVNQLSMDRKFSLRNGEVNVTDSGLYFVYAQIYYLTEHDTNGFHIEVNNKPVLQCTVTSGQTADGPRSLKSNSCFTAGALYLAPGDRVSIREVGALRWTVFEPQKSFFGLVKLGHTSRIT